MTLEALAFLAVVGLPVALVLLYFRRPIEPVPPSKEHDTASEDTNLTGGGGVEGAMDSTARNLRHGHRQ